MVTKKVHAVTPALSFFKHYQSSTSLMCVYVLLHYFLLWKGEMHQCFLRRLIILLLALPNHACRVLQGTPITEREHVRDAFSLVDLFFPIEGVDNSA